MSVFFSKIIPVIRSVASNMSPTDWKNSHPLNQHFQILQIFPEALLLTIKKQMENIRAHQNWGKNILGAPLCVVKKTNLSMLAN